MGGEARARPRVDRRPLGAASTCASSPRPPGACSASRSRGLVGSPRRRLAAAMCGICGIALAAGAPTPPRLRSDERDRSCIAGPTATGPARRRRGRPRRAPPLDHRPRDRRPAARERGRDASSSSRTGRSTTTASSARELERAGAPLPHARRHGGARPPLRAARRRASRERLRGHVRGRDLGRAAPHGSSSRATAFGIKPLYYRARRRAGSSSRPSCARCRAARSTSTRSRPSSPSTRSRRRSRSCAGRRKLPPGHLLVWEGGEPRLERYARPGARSTADGAPTSRRGRARRGAAEPAARLRARASRRRRAGRRPPLRRRRLVRCSPRSRRRRRPEPVRTFTIGFAERSFDERRDARLVAERYGTRPPRARRCEPDAALLLPALAEAFDEPFADSSALPTYLVSAARGRAT